MVDCDSPDVKKWEKEARALQQDVFLHLGDKEWDQWDKSDKTVLYRKVGYGLYSLPENSPDGNNSTGYSSEQVKNIELVADAILKNCKNDRFINFACIFVFVKIHENHLFTPVFKILGKENETVFVDSDCRVYKNWQDYLKSNCLPKCLYCYPRDGLYQCDKNQVIVDFSTSPACNPENDSGETMVSFSSTAMMAASLFTVPIATPNWNEIQTAPARIEAQCGVEANSDLEDGQLNSQDQDLDTSEDNMNFFEFLGNILNVVQNCLGESIAESAKAGDLPTKEMSIIHDVVTLGSLTVNGVGALIGFISLVDKAEKNTLTSLDISHFTDSLLFFSNTFLQAETALGIIKKVQQQILNQHCEDLTALQIQELFGLFEQIEGKTQVHRNANKIKAINYISNKESFYESLVTMRSELEGHRVQFSFEELGLININNELHIAPNKLLEISEEDRHVILDATEKQNDSGTENKVYWDNLEKKLKNNRIKMEYQRRLVKNQLKRVFDKDSLDKIKIGNEPIFKNITPPELDRLGDVMAIHEKNYRRISKIVNEFAKELSCKTVFDYCNYFEFIAKRLQVLRDEKEGKYQEALRKSKSEKNFQPRLFDLSYGIVENRRRHFTNQVFCDFDTNWNESLRDLLQFYSKQGSKVLVSNARIDPKFAFDTAAIYHYCKHSEFGSRKLTEEEYFEFASELVNEPLNERSAMLNQQGNERRFTFTNPINGYKGIVVEPIGGGERYIVTFYYDKSVMNQ